MLDQVIFYAVTVAIFIGSASALMQPGFMIIV